MEDDDKDHETNGNAYQKKEDRHGVPLSYVGEKIRYTIEALHALIQYAGEDIPDDLPVPSRFPKKPDWQLYSIKNDSVLSPAREAMRNAAKAFLALYNMLNLPGEENLVSLLLSMSRQELKAWLDRVEGEGSVT